MPVYQFSSPQQRQPVPEDDNQTQSWFGDRAQRQFGPEFGEIAREANVLFRDMRPLLIDNPLAMLDILRTQPDAEMLDWVISGLKIIISMPTMSLAIRCVQCGTTVKT